MCRYRLADSGHVARILGGESVAAGQMTRHALRTRYTAIYPNVYVPEGCRTHRSGARRGRVAVVGGVVS